MRNDKINTKFHELGKAIGLDECEICRAKRTAKTIISMGILTVIFGLIGFLSSRYDAVGLWYVAASAKDFNFLNNFF